MFEEKERLKALLRKVRALELRLKSQVDTALVGSYRSFFLGTGVDFAEIRPYVEGDDIRFIDWNVTARYGKPYLRLYQEERELKLFFLLDVSASMFFYNKYEVAVEALAIIAFSALKNGDRFGLLCFGERIEAFLPIRKGEQAFFQLLLTVVAMPRKRRKTNLNHVFQYVRRLTRRRHYFVVISDFLDEGYESALLALGQQHEVLLIRPWNELEGKLPPFGTIPVRDAETSEWMWVPSFFKRKIEDYPKAIHRRLKTLRSQPRIDYLPINTNISVMKQLRAFYAKRQNRI